MLGVMGAGDLGGYIHLKNKPISKKNMHRILRLIATKSAEEMNDQLEFLGNYLQTELNKNNLDN